MSNSELAFFTGMGITVVVAILVVVVVLCVAGLSVWRNRKASGEIAPYTTYREFMSSSFKTIFKILLKRK